jgi:modulator of FtsH protease HflK
MPNQNQEPPWGRKRKPQTPEELVAQVIQKIQDLFSDKKSHGPGNSEEEHREKPANPIGNVGKILAILLIGIIFIGVYSSVYSLNPTEVGVVLRFGKYDRTVSSGLRFTIPYAERLIKVPVMKVQKEEFGYRSRVPGQVSTFDRQGYEKESLMLTADTNVIKVNWIVQYRISDPKDYLFEVKDVKQAVRDISESVTRRIVGNMDFDFVLGNRGMLAADVKREIQAQLDNLHAGVAIGTVQFQDINPPDPVKPAFNEVNEADQDMKRLVNEAEETYNKVIPKAKGEARKITETAQGYAFERVNNAKGETQRFLDILKEYKKAPEVTRRRMYLETMQSILPSVHSVYVLDKNLQGPLPLLNITGSKSLPASGTK